MRLCIIDYENDEFDTCYGYLDKIDKSYKPLFINLLYADSYILDKNFEKAIGYFEKCCQEIE